MEPDATGPDRQHTAHSIHASAVAIDGRAVLLTGPSGSGKSSLALELLALGGRLVADDAVYLALDPAGRLVARGPEATRGLIEARGVGILRADAVAEAPVALVVDMGTAEAERLPPRRSVTLLGVALPLLHKAESRCFPAAIRQYLRYGRNA
jgi:HPr kinase/phosphorylase